MTKPQATPDFWAFFIMYLIGILAKTIELFVLNFSRIFYKIKIENNSNKEGSPMTSFLLPVLKKIQNTLDQTETIQIFSDYFHIPLQPYEINFTILSKKIPTDWGWMTSIYIKGKIHKPLSLYKCDLFKIKTMGPKGNLQFEAAISEMNFNEKGIYSLEFTSCGEIQQF